MEKKREFHWDQEAELYQENQVWGKLRINTTKSRRVRVLMESWNNYHRRFEYHWEDIFYFGEYEMRDERFEKELMPRTKRMLEMLDEMKKMSEDCKK